MALQRTFSSSLAYPRTPTCTATRFGLPHSFSSRQVYMEPLYSNLTKPPLSIIPLFLLRVWTPFPLLLMIQQPCGAALATKRLNAKTIPMKG